MRNKTKIILLLLIIILLITLLPTLLLRIPKDIPSPIIDIALSIIQTLCYIFIVFYYLTYVILVIKLGKPIYKISRSLSDWVIILIGLFSVYMSIYIMYTHSLQGNMESILEFINNLAFVIIAPSFILYGITSNRIYKEGILLGLELINWSEIKSYTIESNSELSFIIVKNNTKRKRPIEIKMNTPLPQQKEIEKIFRQNINST